MQISPLTSIAGSDGHVDTSTGYGSPQIIMGESSQVYDVIQSGTITIRNINLLALGDFDKLLSCKVDEQILGVYELLPKFTQVILLAATMPQHMLDVAARMTREPLQITVLLFRQISL